MSRIAKRHTCSFYRPVYIALGSRPGMLPRIRRMSLSGLKLLGARLVALLVIMALTPLPAVVGAFHEAPESCPRHRTECECPEMCIRPTAPEEPEPSCHGDKSALAERPQCSMSGCKDGDGFHGVTPMRSFLLGATPALAGPGPVDGGPLERAFGEAGRLGPPPPPPPRS